MLKQKEYRKTYDAAEDAKRFLIFKKNWEETLEHNEKYAKGEIYYPNWSSSTFDETEEEYKERLSRPYN